ncbi:MAG: phosphoesterase, partial [Paenibacillus sp.]|nr:phosphoesterase [Paenibacillus sp.]
MNRIVNWLKQRERQLFFLVNHKARNGILDVILGTITHLGGATFTIAST